MREEGSEEKKLVLRDLFCAVVRVRGSIQKISGDNSERDPPVPIPNTEVKPLSADGTWLATARESRTSPGSRERRCWRSEEASPTSYSPRWMWDQRMGNGWRGRAAKADTGTPGPRRQAQEERPRKIDPRRQA